MQEFKAQIPNCKQKYNKLYIDLCPSCAYGSHQGMLVCLHMYRQGYLERKNQSIMYYIFLQCALNCLNNLKHRDVKTDGLCVLVLFGMVRMSSAAVWFSHTWSSLDGLSTWAKPRFWVSGFVRTHGTFGSDSGCSHFDEGFCLPKRDSEMSHMGVPLFSSKQSDTGLILSHLWNVFTLCLLTLQQRGWETHVTSLPQALLWGE